MKKIKLFLTLLIILLFAGCSNSNQAPEEQTPPPVNIQEDSSEVTSTEVLQIELDSFNFGYSENEIVLRAGQPVKIILTNSDGMHDFVVDELDIKSQIISAGETTEIDFMATQVGSYEFYCSVGKHRELGMVGTIIVQT